MYFTAVAEELQTEQAVRFKQVMQYVIPQVWQRPEEFTK